jgi:hypothetical protein
MANYKETNQLSTQAPPKAASRGWLKVAVIAWWYRKTLKSLRQTEDSGESTDFRISGRHPSDEE